MKPQGSAPENAPPGHRVGRSCVLPAQHSALGIPSTGPIEAALRFDGRELLRGNRSRLVYLAGELAVRLPSTHGPLDVLVLPKRIRGPSSHITWHDPPTSVLHLAVCFGGAQITELSLRGVHSDVNPSAPFVLSESVPVTWQLARRESSDVSIELLIVVERIPSAHRYEPLTLDSNQTAHLLGITSTQTVENWLHGGSFPGAVQTPTGHFRFSLKDVLHTREWMTDLKARRQAGLLEPPDFGDGEDM